MRVLITTFGYDHSKIIQAMKAVPHDALIVVTSEENSRTEQYKKILEAANMANVPVELLLVDKFDFLSTFHRIVDCISTHRKRGDKVALNVSGGTRILADAALIAAFNTGVECYHIADTVRRLPVLHGVTIMEPLTREQKSILLNLEDGIEVKEAIKLAKDDPRFMDELLKLKKAGVVETRSDSEKVRLFLTDKGQRVLRSMRKKRDS
ncbi:MAG: DUF6293 family protein [Methanomassiliicoccales archaeon]